MAVDLRQPAQPSVLAASILHGPRMPAASVGDSSCLFQVAGEALVDLIQRPNGWLQPQLGGSPWNLARALGRLGCNVRYLSPLSTDRYGQQLAQALLQSRVAVSGPRSPRPTSLALVQLDDQGRPSYAFDREDVADRDLDPLTLSFDPTAVPSVFHVGSLSLLPPDGHAWLRLLAQLQAQGMVTSLDINMRPAVARDPHAYAALARRLVSHGTVVKVSDEDLHAMQLGRTGGNRLAQARGLLSPSTRLVVLTLGSQGAWALSEQHQCFQAPASVPIVDTVGAGDCFYAGFLAELARQNALTPKLDVSAAVLADALAYGNRVTAFNLQQAGCQPPWSHQV